MRDETLVWKVRIGYLTICLEKELEDSLNYFMPGEKHD